MSEKSREVRYNADIPPELAVPPEHTVLLQAYGRGVQIYTCKPTFNTTPKPHAILLGSDRDEGDLVAIHYADPTTGLAISGHPTWEATDGSKVVGQVGKDGKGNPTRVPAPKEDCPDEDCVDWLLLEAIFNSPGEGVFSNVTHIQRLYTDGGQAPKGGCKDENQAELLMEYRAVYVFYGKAN